MISRVVEVANPARLSLKHCQLVIEQEETNSIPVEDLGVLILDNPAITMSQALLGMLATNNVAVVICDDRHMPASLLSPFESNTLHARTLREQIAAVESKRKRVWQWVIQAKIGEQARLVSEVGGNGTPINKLVPFVRSGDPDNLEARAARLYWRALFGEAFIRDYDGIGANSMLNYGYAVVRAATARAIVGAGLHPALGVHHSSQYNAFALADDIMEPLRPLVDSTVVEYLKENEEPEDLTPETKRALLAILTRTVGYGGKRYPLMTTLGLYAANVRKCLLGQGKKLECPSR